MTERVLKLKKKSDLSKITIKRGLDQIMPAIDADGDFILGFQVLADPVYADVTEEILDMCEVKDHKPLDVDSMEDKPVKKIKGQFANLLASANNTEEAVLLYYNVKKGFFPKMINLLAGIFT